VARGQGTISDPPAAFVLGLSPFDASPDANLTGVSSTLTDDHLFQTGWWYRVAGDTAETFFPVPATQVYAGNTATLTWTDVDGRGFDARLVYVVVNEGGPSGYLRGQLTIQNPGPAALALDVFHMVDLDVQPLAGNDSATLAGPNEIAVTDPTGTSARYRGTDASAFLVREFGASDLGTVLGDTGVTYFDDSGLPFGPGDITAGFQWTAAIPAGAERSFTVVLAIGDLGPTADLGIAVSDGLTAYRPGQVLTYGITVTNAGPDAVAAATATDVFPADLTGVSWTCSASVGSACGSAAGTGNILATVDLLPGGSATFTATGSASLAAASALTNTAAVAPPGGFLDPVAGNDSATDTDSRAGGAYYSVEPCRLVDTRESPGPFGGPALLAGEARTFAAAGRCGVPASATALSLNLTVTGPTAPGFLQVLPAGGAAPTVSAVNYAPGETRANNGVYALGAGGTLEVRCGQASGSVELILDVSGYFIE
jgi:uncharacterized repeat protein (TIGR01451 family)